MRLSRDYAAHIEDILAPFGKVSVRRMFGGGGVYFEQTMFAIVADDTLYLKADEETARAFAAEGMGPFIYEGEGKPIAMSYWQVPDRLYDAPDELAEWARAAFAVAVRAKATKPARPRRKE